MRSSDAGGASIGVRESSDGTGDGAGVCAGTDAGGARVIRKGRDYRVVQRGIRGGERDDRHTLQPPGSADRRRRIGVREGVRCHSSQALELDPDPSDAKIPLDC